MPALLTTVSEPPMSAAASVKASVTASSEVRSQVRPQTWPRDRLRLAFSTAASAVS